MIKPFDLGALTALRNGAPTSCFRLSMARPQKYWSSHEIKTCENLAV